jgi:hypothetical protein
MKQSRGRPLFTSIEGWVHVRFSPTICYVVYLEWLLVSFCRAHKADEPWF